MVENILLLWPKYACYRELTQVRRLCIAIRPGHIYTHEHTYGCLLGHSVICPRPDRRMYSRLCKAFGYKGSSLKQDACAMHVETVRKALGKGNNNCVFEIHTPCKF